MLTQFPIEGEPLTQEILDYYGFDNNIAHYWICIAMLAVLFVVFRLLVIVSLKCQDNKKSKGMTDTRNTAGPAGHHPKKAS